MLYISRIVLLLGCTLAFGSTLSARQIEHFEHMGHEYIVFDCKAVLHNPDCYKCQFQRYVSYDPQGFFPNYKIIERVEVSPYRYDIPTMQW